MSPLSIPSWFFKEKPMGFKMTENTSGEFFKTLGSQGKAQYLIRESFQNSLDGAIIQGEAIRIRVFISGSERALPKEISEKYFQNLFTHIDACTDINADTANLRNSPCRFLTIEDFETTGLSGDEKTDLEEKSNHFYHFFRSVGRSGKDGNKLGRWGIGKFVYTMASETRSVFGYTVRNHTDSDRQKLLMGQATLRYHKIGETQYINDGWFAKDFSDFPPLPFSDVEILDDFRKTFSVSRKDETGFSVVVPYCEGIEPEEILFAVINEYCGSIMSEKLVVDFDLPNEKPFSVDSKTILEIVKSRQQIKRWNELDRLLSLVSFVIENDRQKIVVLPAVESRPDWNDFIIPDDVKEQIVSLLDGHGIVRIRIPVKAKQLRSKDFSIGEFDVILRMYSESNKAIHPVFFRNWLKISGRQMGSASNGIETMVSVKGGILADLLGDAEGPAHTEWTAGGEKFKGKYSFGPEWISFVKSAPKKLVELARGATNERDLNAFADLFPNPEGWKDSRSRQGDSGNEQNEPGPVGPREPNPPKEEREPGVELTGLVGGFTVSLEEGASPKYLVIDMGYETGRGNALKNWESFDFEISELDIVLKHGILKFSEGNRMLIQVLNDDKFRLSVKGFDTSRTLRVLVKAQSSSKI